VQEGNFAKNAPGKIPEPAEDLSFLDDFTGLPNPNAPPRAPTFDPLSERLLKTAQGRTAPGKIVTNARPGTSAHNFGAAYDIGFFQNGGRCGLLVGPALGP
jgi:hypothetical protein